MNLERVIDDADPTVKALIADLPAPARALMEKVFMSTLPKPSIKL